MPRTIKASEFKAQCLALVDEVARTGECFVITKNGEPVAELRPHKPKAKNARGIWKGSFEIVGDIMSPIDIEWNAMK